MRGDGGRFRWVYVNPQTGAVQGRLGDNACFAVVLEIHRTLCLGTAGRVVVEGTACWAIVLFLTGLYLWWPRTEDLGGLSAAVARPAVHPVTGSPRRRRHLPRAARPRHRPDRAALLGRLGGGLPPRRGGDGGAHGRVQTPARGRPSAGRPPLSLDDAVILARGHCPEDTLMVSVPGGAGETILVRAAGTRGPAFHRALTIDLVAGVVEDRPASQFPVLAQGYVWGYAVHVGSIFGLPTKVLALAACVALIGMVVSGVWMWWQRRPPGQTGFPRRPPAVRLPWWVVLGVLIVCVLLPVVRASVLLILLGEWGWIRWVRG